MKSRLAKIAAAAVMVLGSMAPTASFADWNDPVYSGSTYSYCSGSSCYLVSCNQYGCSVIATWPRGREVREDG
jgi:hypothetical protein